MSFRQLTAFFDSIDPQLPSPICAFCGATFVERPLCDERGSSNPPSMLRRMSLFVADFVAEVGCR
jgi:hypothetical protein